MENLTLAKLHSVMLEILDEFDRICKLHNLSYFFTCGTLLGAIRHKGYIPWDDDMDVGMPRKDFEKFIRIFKNIENSNYYLMFTNNPHINPWLKMCKKNTKFSERQFDGTPSEQGIFIDIWVYDNTFFLFLPFQLFFINLIRKIYLIKINVDEPKKWFVKYPLKFFSIFFPLKFCAWFPEYFSRIFSKFNSNYIVDFSSEKVFKFSYKMKTIFPTIKLLFEGKYYNAPNDYDTCLKKQYGNYMELPPVEKRVGHLPEFVIFDTSSDKI